MGRRPGWLCPAPSDDGETTSTSPCPGGRWGCSGSVVYVVIHSSPQDGVVATLARVRIPPPDLPLPAAPLLQPFPSPQMNLEGDCNALQNVDAIEVGTKITFLLTISYQIDPLGRLWVVDSGQTAPFSRPHRNCPPKLLVFDLAKGF